MTSRSLNNRHGALLLRERPLRSNPEQRERPEAFDAPAGREAGGTVRAAEPSISQARRRLNK